MRQGAAHCAINFRIVEALALFVTTFAGRLSQFGQTFRDTLPGGRHAAVTCDDSGGWLATADS